MAEWLYSENTLAWHASCDPKNYAGEDTELIPQTVQISNAFMMQTTYKEETHKNQINKAKWSKPPYTFYEKSTGKRSRGREVNRKIENLNFSSSPQTAPMMVKIDPG